MSRARQRQTVSHAPRASRPSRRALPQHGECCALALSLLRLAPQRVCLRGELACRCSAAQVKKIEKEGFFPLKMKPEQAFEGFLMRICSLLSKTRAELRFDFDDTAPAACGANGHRFDEKAKVTLALAL